ncbi:MAG: invasion associated locus B family protein [Pseudomonadota bacterium]
MSFTMGHRRRSTQLLAIIAGLALTPAAIGASLGSFKDWSAQSFEMDGKRVCSLWSAPHTAEGKYTRRGDIFVWVTHRPSDSATNRVSFEMGYPIKSGTRLKVTIDNEKYELLTDGSTGFNLDERSDERMVKAMRAAKEMEVRGISRRGTHTRDVYSLFGFTAAHRAIGKACKVR